MNDPKYPYPYPAQGTFFNPIFVSVLSGKSLLFSLLLALICSSAGYDDSCSCPHLHVLAIFFPHISLLHMARILFVPWELWTILSLHSSNLEHVWSGINCYVQNSSSDVTCFVSSFCKPRFANHRHVFYYRPLSGASSDGAAAVRASSVCPSAVRPSAPASTERTRLHWGVVCSWAFLFNFVQSLLL